MNFNGKCIAMMDDRSLVQCLSIFLSDRCDDYAEVKKRYEESVSIMKKQISVDMHGHIDSFVTAYMCQIASDMVFAYMLGFRFNLEHFRNPLLPNMIEVEPEVFLKENVMRTMPKRVEAQLVIQKIHKEFENMNFDYEPVYEYFAYLETFAGKYGHYLGFLDANKLLYLTEPGYTEDRLLTKAYGEYINQFTVMSIENGNGVA